MSKITEKQLISQLKQLKEIKPNKEWAVLLKSKIITEQKPVVIKAQSISFTDIIRSVFYQRKMAYSFAALFLMVVGVLGFANYTMPGDLLFPVKKIAEQSQAALTGQSGLRQNVAVLNSRINDLAQVSKDGRKDSISSAISEVETNVTALVNNLKTGTADATTIKEIVSSLKTLADVPGTDLSTNQDVKDLYQAVVQAQIADLNKATLTDDQKEVLSEIQELYLQGKYTDALEKILLINQ